MPTTDPQNLSLLNQTLGLGRLFRPQILNDFLRQQAEARQSPVSPLESMVQGMAPPTEQALTQSAPQPIGETPVGPAAAEAAPLPGPQEQAVAPGQRDVRVRRRMQRAQLVGQRAKMQRKPAANPQDAQRRQRLGQVSLDNRKRDV